MIWEKLIIALVPIPVYYLIYFRYFTFRPEYLKHVESFLSGIAFAFSLILVSPYLFRLFPFTDPLAVGFLKAAVTEKAGACIILMFLFRYYANFSIMEATVSAALFGVGFSAVENIAYALSFGYSVILPRLLFSVPMHLTTCGIMGFYLGMMKMCETRVFKSLYFLKAVAAAILLHGLFDTILLTGGEASYSAPPMLVVIVVILEILMARAQNIPPHNIIRAMNLRFEDWMILERQPRFERWILRSMGTGREPATHFFLWRPGAIRFISVLALLALAVFGLAYRENIVLEAGLGIRNVEQILLFGSLPVSVSVIIILVGAINPVFFASGVFRIPVISDVVVRAEDGFEETLVTYDITTANCFLRTSEPCGMGTPLPLRFEYSSRSSDEIIGEVVWENHTNPRASIGSIVRLPDRSGLPFLRFMIRYHYFRMRKGIAFNLKLPGFEATRKLFMRPITTMQEDRIYKAGSVIFNEGDKGTEFYLLKKGRIQFYKTTEKGDRILMDTIEDQEIFGEMAVMGNVTRATTALCETETVVAAADRENLTALIKNNTDFAVSLIETLAHRVQNSEEILLDNIRTLDASLAGKDRLYRCALLLGYAALHGAALEGEEKDRILRAAEQAAGETGDRDLASLAALALSGRDGTDDEAFRLRMREILAGLPSLPV